MTKTPINLIQRAAFHFLWNGANPDNGLVPDQISLASNGEIHRSPSSIAVTGMALSALPVATENGWISRRDAAARARATLRFFAREAEQFGGFFFHFLDLASGKRVWKCEVSSVDSTFLFLGALFCEVFFDKKSGSENEIRELSQEIFARANWNWFSDGKDAVSIAYKPERGFSKHAWRGYNEALPLAVLSLGAPQFSLPLPSYGAWTQTYRFKRLYGREHVFCGPLFTHLFPHLWLDLRGLFDAPLQKHGLDYFENTVRAVEIQHQWAKKRGDERKWGVSACDAPQGGTLGGYRARGVPFGRFDEVFSPPVCLASLPFAPELAMESWNFWEENHPEIVGAWGVRGAVHVPSGWMSAFFGLDQGLLILMLENAKSGLLWELSRRIMPLQRGLERAGFQPRK
ncbi:hypothetical protein B1R32_11911 [Abditibacterium utsteinense]|uniref:Glycoamylase-like domain-containing protein n=1 Tax=Abditibacterium utsteinense TaxID=1960156 RepID=A0A2S8SPZ9_9BACT|nr:glucoamylase family protein [Abditibacterium utsteinense]PQV62871.1 hypothetical protein B1R32_11911 [Abditibacterium utsteinense]